MTYGIDIDGVLADFVRGFGDLARTLGYEIVPNNWGLGLTREQEQAVWKLVEEKNDFWLTLPVLNYFPQDMLKVDDVVYFITKRKPTPGRSTSNDTANWIGFTLDWNDFPTVLAIPNKGEVCRALKVDAFIDDKPENCWDVMDKSPATKVFLMDQPWNQWDTRVSRVKSLEEFIERSNG